MKSDKQFDSLSSKFLGQEGSYAVNTDHFDPSFLIAMPRKNIRDLYGVTGKEFEGSDVWHCHEATFLLDSGMPIAGTLKITYPCKSTYMVESKSLKLYLNSFDFCKMGRLVDKATAAYEDQISKDLSSILFCHVSVKFYGDIYRQPINDFKHYSDLQVIEGLFLNEVLVEDYTAQQNHLIFKESETDHTYYLKTNVLRSRCRHTKQKDTGTAFFYISTRKSELITTSLLKQVISLRNLDEFHEFCAEKLYMDLMNTGFVEECCVSLLYSRRGSLDINPIRSTYRSILPAIFGDVNRYSYKQQNQ